MSMITIAVAPATITALEKIVRCVLYSDANADVKIAAFSMVATTLKPVTTITNCTFTSGRK